MPQCVGVTAKNLRCRMGARQHCLKCDAYLCVWHAVWNDGAHCPWCGDRLEIRYTDGWAVPTPRPGAIVRKDRGVYAMPVPPPASQ